MKICKTELEYIRYVAPFAQKACKRFEMELGKPFYKPSDLIAQSIQENGYGIPSYWDNPGVEALVKFNNMIGIKRFLLNDTWTDIGLGCWDGKYINKKTPEVYGGKATEIYADFRIYKDVEQSFVDYLCFMRWGGYSINNPKYYNAIKDLTDPFKIIKKVHELGYATGPTYSDKCIEHIKKHNLTQYDDLTGVEPSAYYPAAGVAQKKGSGTETILNAKGKKVMLDAGHYGYYNQSPAVKEYWESKMTWKLHLMLKEELEKYGIVVGTTRKSQEKDRALYDRGYASKGYDLFLSIHSNAVGDNVNEKVDYPVCFVQISGKSDKIGTLLSECVHDVMQTAQPADHWSQKGNNGDYYGVLRGAAAAGTVGCIIEHSFHTQTRATKWLLQDSNLRKMAIAEAKVIAEYLAGVKSSKPSSASSVPHSKNYLSNGDSGDAVKTMQTMLIKCGYSCGKTGADGIFGSGTESAVRNFQKAEKLSVDGLYGPKTKAALEAANKAKEAPAAKPVSTIPQKAEKWAAHKVMSFVMKVVADMARTFRWKYGDSQSLPPCKDGVISCDRLIALALWFMGFRDQRKGGEVCSTLGPYLAKHGWKKVTKKADVKPGAVVAVKDKKHRGIDHVFYVVDYDPKRDLCTKFDEGSDERIQTVQPFKNKKLVEWPAKELVCAWNVPAWIGSGTPGKYILDGVDYSPAFNAIYYYKMYPDLYKAFGTDKIKLFEHFCKNGMREGRQACANFNANAYRNRYDDLKKAFGSDLRKYYKHWCTKGRTEGKIGV